MLVGYNKYNTMFVGYNKYNTILIGYNTTQCLQEDQTDSSSCDSDRSEHCFHHQHRDTEDKQVRRYIYNNIGYL